IQRLRCSTPHDDTIPVDPNPVVPHPGKGKKRQSTAVGRLFRGSLNFSLGHSVEQIVRIKLAGRNVE
ncbi:hypothetical protein Droror1_Dr00020531, partial [Drosera rotundifolia]